MYAHKNFTCIVTLKLTGSKTFQNRIGAAAPMAHWTRGYGFRSANYRRGSQVLGPVLQNSFAAETFFAPPPPDFFPIVLSRSPPC
jgi:hypothetical protein